MRSAHRPPKNNHGHPTSDALRDKIHPVDLVYSISGFSVGVLVGITGVGGGSLMTPLLIILFGVHPATQWGLILSMRQQPRAPVRSSTASTKR
jgi:hypothetical protein